MQDPRVDHILARSLLAARSTRRGRAVPSDPRGEPEARPRYPRYARLASGTTDAPRDAHAPGRHARRAAARKATP